MRLNKQSIKTAVLLYCPDIFGLHRFLTARKVASLRAKFISDEEVRAGEGDAPRKQEIVEKYRKLWPKYVSMIDGDVETLLGNAPDYRERLDLDKIRTDMYFCYLAYGFRADEYVFFRLENRGMEERRQFVSNLDRIIGAFRMNDFSDMRIYNDKWRSYQSFARFYKRDAICVSSDRDWEAFRKFTEKHPVFVKKQVDLSWGQSVGLVRMADYASAEEAFALLKKQGKLILEEAIVQSEKLALFNPDSVNTIRCVTMRTRNGTRVFPHSFFKNGRKGSFVDNGGAGGILVSIDDETGCLNSDGYDELGNIYACHPDSGIAYKGYQLPDWDQVHALCKEAAEVFPRMKYSSWDLAHTDKGWVIVEANMAGQMVAQQMTIQRGLKAEWESCLSEIDLLV